MSKEKIVLAYSGGLDTSVIIPWLKENYDAEVIAVCGDVGQGKETEGLEEKALKTGASKLYIADLTEEFITDAIYPVSYTHLDVYKRQVISLCPWSMTMGFRNFLKTKKTHNAIKQIAKGQQPQKIHKRSPFSCKKNARNLGLPDVFVRLFSKNRISGIFIRKQRNLLGMFSDEGSRRNFP